MGAGKGYNSAVECHLDVVEVISSSLIIPKPNVSFSILICYPAVIAKKGVGPIILTSVLLPLFFFNNTRSGSSPNRINIKASQIINVEEIMKAVNLEMKIVEG